MCTHKTKVKERCFICDPIIADFTILYKPEIKMAPDEHVFCIAECMAEHFTEIAAIADYQKYLENHE